MSKEDRKQGHLSSRFRFMDRELWNWVFSFFAGILVAWIFRLDLTVGTSPVFDLFFSPEHRSAYENKYDTSPAECHNMGLNYEEFLDLVLFRRNIYKDFPGEKSNDIGFYFSADVFERVFSEYFQVHQSLTSIRVVEIGSWAGRSTINIARLCERLAEGRGCSVIAVDTWTGSSEHYEGFGLPRNENGNLQLYDNFMNNVKHAELAHVITPFRITSSSAAHVFRCFNISVDIVYLDGDHEYSAVAHDIVAYYSLLKPGGVLIGDDFILKGVRKAVEDVSAVINEPFAVTGDKWDTWVIKKSVR